jgi:signal transduction histidine kinase
VVQDEYILYHEARAREQWEAETSQLRDQLREASVAFEGDRERATLVEMAGLIERSNNLFHQIVESPSKQAKQELETPASIALRERVTNNLILLTYDLYSRASWLSESAAKREQTNQKRLIFIVFAMICAILAITIVNAYSASELLERRITLLLEGADHVAAGNLDHRIAIVGNDELADLGRAFDTMSTRLHESRVALVSSAADVAGLNKKLRMRLWQVEEANKELDSFAHSVSHDLRAPLRHIESFAELLRLRASASLDEKSQHYLQVISEAAKKLGVLIGDLLAFSRLGRTEMPLNRVSFQRLVDEVVVEFSPETECREIVWDIAALPDVMGNEAMLRQVWANLISNAIKFSRERTPATIAIGAVEAGLTETHFYVKDNGAGFDMGYAERLFGVFQRLHTADQFEGTGIGLANVQRIVQRHCGRVWAEGALDKGATFWFSLPNRKGFKDES